jgi:hypothetical protein
MFFTANHPYIYGSDLVLGGGGRFSKMIAALRKRFVAGSAKEAQGASIEVSKKVN